MNAKRSLGILRATVLLLFAAMGTTFADRIIYVDVDAKGANDGSSWENAYKYLQDALADANSSPKPIEIRVAQGIYRPDEDTLHPDGTGHREATFQLINGVTIKGSYAGFGSPDPNDRNIDLYETLLSGDLNGNDGPDFANNNENSYHVFYHPEGLNLDDTAILDGFVITAGNADSTFWPYSEGAGMYNCQSSPTINNCTFGTNAARRGAGMCNWNFSNPTVKNSTFTANSAVLYGGGMHNSSESSPAVNNCTFSANAANKGGGMINWNLCSPNINNCTFTENSASNDAGGMYNYKSTVVMRNCIIWNGIDWLYDTDNSAVTVTYSDVEGGWPEEGNIDTDPCFVDPGYWDANGTPDDRTDDFWVDGDYHLLWNSPCINAGDPNFVAGPNDADMDGEKRVMLGRLDMGADEFNPFSAEFVVVRRQRVDRTVFEYECEVVLKNVSTFALENVSLKMARSSRNMTIVDPNVTFDPVTIGPGESATSLDTCTFTVERAEPIDPGAIIWRVTTELADTGAKMEHTLASIPPLGPPETGFEYLAKLAEQWLWVGMPGGIEQDAIPDGTVNLADFARFADNWKTNP